MEDLPATSDPRDLTIEERVELQRQLAQNLAPYVGRWVMVKGAEVLNVADTPAQLTSTNEITDYDRVFKVMDGRKKFRSLRLAA